MPDLRTMAAHNAWIFEALRPSALNESPRDPYQIEIRD